MTLNSSEGKGLHVPSLEKDSCGTGLIANLNGTKSHQLIDDALTMLHNMEHRGACGCEPNTGDGAGILIQTPHDFFVKKCREAGFELPDFGEYGVGMVFFPKDKNLMSQSRVLFNDYIDEQGFELLGYRKVPTDNEELGATAISVEPRIEQVFVKPKVALDRRTLERRLHVLRKFATHNIHKTFPQTADHFYLCSFSYKTVVYKGQLTTGQLRSYYPDLQNEDCTSAIALIHSRFSTNTVPKWKLAQPFRYVAHNGEINTIQGNINWWKSKEFLLESEYFDEIELEKLKPIIGPSLSDSGSFDNVLEFLVLSGRSMPHALMMMIPEAWEHDPHMSQYKKDFYEYHSNLMEPWDGPASIAFTDGILVGATLDRNGLRPSRYLLTEDNTLIVASEAGVLPVDPATVVFKGRLQPGKMLIADMDEKRVIGDEELKNVICQNAPYRDWLDNGRITLKDLPPHIPASIGFDDHTLLRLQQLHGFTREDLKVIIGPMIEAAQDPIGSMGTDTPLAVLSHQSQHLANYFKQLFAQVTNPPIDPIRERDVMSLYAKLGSSDNILKPSKVQARFIHLDQPVLTNDQLNKIRQINHEHFKSGTIDTVFRADAQSGRLVAALDNICAAAEDLVQNGSNILILSDKAADAFHAPIPSLLAVGAIHHHLIKVGLRTKTSLIVEAGDIRETHHFATLIGYGANAINPYLTYATIDGLRRKRFFEGARTSDELIKIYIKAIGKGLLKIMSKIGISTLQSYHGAQIFEILGLRNDVVHRCFKGSVSRIEGMGFDEIGRETIQRHHLAFPQNLTAPADLEVGGVYQWKQRGETHLFNPQTIHLLQYATRRADYNLFKKYSTLINDQSEKALTLRGLLTFRKGQSISLDELEPVEDILRRFATGAMSFGSISHEAHSTLAIAMNRIGGKSNSGEGGEDEVRFGIKENGDLERSAIKQVA
ncbi:MAG: glutamate synthase subunit alpha, partial [Saprospiraceae bacterium]|nr:glutamate synthase subunit alpha [Saprospiraceae bacterium]